MEWLWCSLRERERELFGRICVSAVSSKCLEKNGKVKAPPTWSHHIKYPQWTWGSLKQKQKKSSHFRGRSTENILRVKSVSGPQVHHYTPSLVANVRLWTKGWEGCGEFTGLSRLWMMVDGKKKIRSCLTVLASGKRVFWRWCRLSHTRLNKASHKERSLWGCKVSS